MRVIPPPGWWKKEDQGVEIDSVEPGKPSRVTGYPVSTNKQLSQKAKEQKRGKATIGAGERANISEYLFLQWDSMAFS